MNRNVRIHFVDHSFEYNDESEVKRWIRDYNIVSLFSFNTSAVEDIPKAKSLKALSLWNVKSVDKIVKLTETEHYLHVLEVTFPRK